MQERYLDELLIKKWIEEHGSRELSFTKLGMLVREAKLKFRRASLLKEVREVTNGTDIKIREEDTYDKKGGKAKEYYLRWIPHSVGLRTMMPVSKGAIGRRFRACFTTIAMATTEWTTFSMAYWVLRQQIEFMAKLTQINTSHTSTLQKPGKG